MWSSRKKSRLVRKVFTESHEYYQSRMGMSQEVAQEASGPISICGQASRGSTIVDSVWFHITGDSPESSTLLYKRQSTDTYLESSRADHANQIVYFGQLDQMSVGALKSILHHIRCIQHQDAAAARLSQLREELI